MKRRSVVKGEKSTGIALVFFLFCALLIGLGILTKFALLFFAAKFDGSHQIILQVQSVPTAVTYISLSPDNQTASVLHVTSKDASDIGKYLGIPIDVKVDADPSLSLTDLGQYILFHQNRKDTLNIIDRIRVFLYTSQVKETDISQKSVTTDDKKSVLDALIPQLFTDHTLYSENQTISIVNATGISGVGNAAARIVSDLGGNVISVGTGNNVAVSSLVYYGKPSYTTKRLAEIFHTVAHSTASAMLSDIVITIGKDNAAAFE